MLVCLVGAGRVEAHPNALTGFSAGSRQAPDSIDSRAPVRHVIYSSRDSGRTWLPEDSGLSEDHQVSFMEPWRGRLVIGTERHGLWIGNPRKRDWLRSGAGLPGVKITAVHVAGRWLYVGVYEKGIFASNDGGRSWRSLNGDLSDRRVRAIMAVEGGLVVGTDSGIFSKRDGHSAWIPVFAEGQIVSLDKSGRRLVGGGAFGTVLSSDEGRHWRWIHQQGAAHNTAIIDDRIVLMNVSGELLMSDDWGSTWTAQPYGPREQSYVYDVVGAGPRLIASNNYGLHASADGGRHWELVHPTEEVVFFDFATVGEVLYAGTRDWGERRARSSQPRDATTP